MATKSLVPRATGEGGIGTSAKHWGTGYIDTMTVSSAFYPPILTTTARDALTAVEGMVIYNTSTNKLNFYNGTAWEVVTSSA